MPTLTGTTVTQTYNRGVSRRNASSFDTNSASYVDVSELSIASVPNGAKIYFNLVVNKATAGTMDLRVTDGTTAFFEQTGITSGSTQKFTSLDGSVTQSSGGSATVKVQIRSSDANNASVLGISSTVSNWVAATDCSNPIVLSGGTQNMVISGKRSIGQLKIFMGNSSSTAQTVHVTGVSIIDNATGEAGNSVNLDTMTSRLDINFTAAPVWTTTNGVAALIIAYDGFNVEVTA